MSSLHDSAVNIAQIFEKACCLGCFVVDTAMPDEYGLRKSNAFCSACMDEQFRLNGQLQCEYVHRHGILQAEKWGGKYEYLCPAGAAFICATLPGEGDIRCGVTAGPFLMVDVGEFVYGDLERLFGNVPKVLVAKADTLPYLDSERVSYLATMLAMTAAYAAERDNYQLRIMQQIAQCQNDVYTAIYGLRDHKAVEKGYPIIQEKRLQVYIAQGNKTAAQKTLNEILGHIFFCSGGRFDDIKARITELVVILSRAAIEGGANISEVFGLNRDYLSDIQAFESLDDLNRWLVGVLTRFTNSVFDFSAVKHADQIKRIMTFVQQNYMKKISLNDISNDTNLSVSYLSKIFKEETGQSLSAYINQVRVENAKMLLLDEKIPLIDVAYLSGFEDQSYFSKVFKKVARVTPGRYREKNGNI